MVQRYLKCIVIGLSMIIPLGLIALFYYRPSSVVIDIQRLAGKENIVPILVIGSGCAGYSAAVYGARGKVKTVVLGGGQPGGQLSGTTKVENMPGLIEQLGPDIMQTIQKQAESFGAEVVYVSATNIDFSQWPYRVTLEDGKIVYALTIIIATGASPAKLNIPGEQQFWGKGVTTCAICDAPFHKGSDVIVVGGGDSAIEEALQLSAYAKTVTIVVRKDKMRASPSMQDRLKDIDSIKIEYNTQVVEIHGDEDGVTHVDLLNNSTNTVTQREVSGLFLAIGHIPNTALFKGSLEIDHDGYVITKDKSQATSMPGVFAAGDVEDKVYRQAGVATGSGIKAALDALAFLQSHGFNAPFAQKMEPHYFTKKITTNHLNNNKSFVHKITSSKEFDLLRSKKHILVVDFYTNFCPSCKFMMPAFEQVAQKFADIATFIKIDADEVQDLSRRYKISSVPTLLLFKDGALIDSRNEAISEGELSEFVQQVV